MKRKQRDHRITDFDLDLDDDFLLSRPGQRPRAPRKSKRRDPQWDRRVSRPRRSGDNSLAYGFLIFLLLAGGVYAWIQLGGDSGPGQNGGTPNVQAAAANKPGTLQLASTPSAAKIYLDDKYVGDTPQTFDKLAPGEYAVRLELPGYQPWTRSVKVEGGTASTVKAELKAAYYRLRVKTNVRKAKIRLLDTNRLFKQGMLLKPGRYRIQVTAPGYIKAVKQVTVRDRDLVKTVTLARAKVFYKVRIKLDPPQAAPLARIRILDWPKPYRQDGIRLSEGSYTVEVKAEGYKTKRQSFEVTDRKKTVRVKLISPGVRLTVKTQPRSAEVRILNYNESYIPGMLMPPGKYQIQVSAPGYQTSKKWIRLVRTGSVSFSLKEARFALKVATTPKNATVKIVEPKNIDYRRGRKLKPGRYRIAVSAPGYETQHKWVQIKDKQASVSVSLKKQGYALKLHTVPKNAKIVFDGRSIRYRPGIKLHPGKYRITVSADGFDTQKHEIEIGNKPVEKKITLKPNRFLIRLAVEPPNAKIEMLEPENAVYKKWRRYKPGTYRLRISAPGYRAKIQVVTLKDKDIRLKLKLGEDLGRLTVKTSPPGAKVVIVGHPEPYSPGLNLLPGTYRLEISAPGYKTVSRTIIMTEQDMTLSVKLEKPLYALTVNPTPADANIEIVDYPRKYKPGIKLPPGNYLIRALKENFRPTSRWVRIKDRDVTIHLKMNSQAPVLTN